MDMESKSSTSLFRCWTSLHQSTCSRWGGGVSILLFSRWRKAAGEDVEDFPLEWFSLASDSFFEIHSARKILALKNFPTFSSLLEGEIPLPILGWVSEIPGKCAVTNAQCPHLSSLLGLSQQLLLHVFVPKNVHLQAFWNCPQSLSLAILSPFHFSLPRTAMWPGVMKVMDAEEEKFHETLPRSVWSWGFWGRGNFGEFFPWSVTEGDYGALTIPLQWTCKKTALSYSPLPTNQLFGAVLLPLVTGI